MSQSLYKVWPKSSPSEDKTRQVWADVCKDWQLNLAKCKQSKTVLVNDCCHPDSDVYLHYCGCSCGPWKNLYHNQMFKYYFTSVILKLSSSFWNNIPLSIYKPKDMKIILPREATVCVEVKQRWYVFTSVRGETGPRKQQKWSKLLLSLHESIPAMSQQPWQVGIFIL